MAEEIIWLRRGPKVEPYALVESDRRFAVHFKTAVAGGSAAKSLLQLPLMFGRQIHARKLPLPPRLAIFEVRPDEAARRLPVYGDDVRSLRDAAMNYIRSSSVDASSVVAACYHTYRRGEASATNRDNEILPSGQLFLEFHPSIPETDQRRVLEHYKLIVDRTIVYHPGAFVVSVTQETGQSPVRLAKELQELTTDPDDAGEAQHVFAWADPLFHRRREYQALPSDGLFAYQWHLRNDGSDGGVVGADIAVTEAWDYTVGDPSVRVAIIDDGFELCHPDIAVSGSVHAPLDAMTGSSDPSPTPGADQWHGTSVLGLISAAHNGRGAVGVAPGCGVIPIKLEALSDDEAEARAFDHAVTHGAAVINCSWGPYDDYSRDPWPMPRIVELAIDNAYRNDVCVVFAAGNGNEAMNGDGYASHRHVIAVSASTDQNRRAYYSDFGANVWVCAPSSGGARGVVTTDLEEGGGNPFGSYATGFGGTSSAAPLVSGVIALMQSAVVRKHGPGNRLGVDEIKDILRRTATRIDQDGPDFHEHWENAPISVRYDRKGHSLAYGYGLVNAGRAVRMAYQKSAPARRRRPAERRGEDTPAPARLTLRMRRVGDPLTLFAKDRAAMPSRSRERFESGEHVWLADRGYQIALSRPAIAERVAYEDYKLIHRRDASVRFRYGELVALSGDFYGSPADLFWEKPGVIPWLWEKNDLSDIRTAFAAEIDAILAQQRGAQIEYPDNNVAYWWNAKQYVELALENTDHFGWHNLKAYCRNHAAALDLALEARALFANDRDRAGEILRQALFTNAFADHFLTDAFAAGHIRVPRAEIRAWALENGLSDKLGGALSKLLHDQDGHLNRFHGQGHSVTADPAEGLLVRNSLGAEWRVRCDGQLFIGSQAEDPLIRNPVDAVAASVDELFSAYLFGTVPDGNYAATTHVPFPVAGVTPGLTEKFPRDATDAVIGALFEGIKWYVKLPMVGADLQEQHIRDLFRVLPTLLERFRARVTEDATDELRRRLPTQLIDAFRSIR